MIKALRRRHLQVWVVLAVAIPAGITCAVFAIPKQALDKLLQPQKTATLPVVVLSVNDSSFTARLRCSNDSTAWQLEWNNKNIITIPSALNYKVPNVTD